MSLPSPGLWDRNRLATQRNFRLNACIFAFVIAATVTFTQVRAEESNLDLPNGTPLGERLRRLGVPESQWVKLIPKGFEPVRLDDLRSILEELSTESSPQSSLRRAIYRITLDGNRVTSRRSTLTIDAAGQNIVSLGRTNVAIEPSLTRRPDLDLESPQLLCGVNGQLRCLTNVTGVDTRADGAPLLLDFAWSRRGERQGTNLSFDLELPAAPIATIELQLPSTMWVRCDEGVVRDVTDSHQAESSSEQQGSARESSEAVLPDSTDAKAIGETSIRRYEIEIGGRSRFGLQIGLEQIDSDATPGVLRSRQTQFELRPAGVSWRQKVAIETPHDFRFDNIRIPVGAVESVTVDSLDVPFSVKQHNDGHSSLSFSLPQDESDGSNEANPVLIELKGHLLPDELDSGGKLPIPRWNAAGVILAMLNEQVELRVHDPIGLSHCQFPNGWHFDRSQTADGVDTWLWSGPPIDNDDAIMVDASPRTDISACRSTVAMQIGTTELRADIRLECDSRPDRSGPLLLNIQSDWVVDSIALSQSGRVVDLATIGKRRNRITIWPDTSEVVDGTIVLDIEARRSVNADTQLSTIAPTWVVRLLAVNTDFAGLVNPPAGMEWSDRTSIESSNEPISRLSIDRQAFLGSVLDDSLYFHNMIGRFPELKLNAPTVSVDATLDLQLDVDGDDIVETLRIVTENGNSSAPLDLEVGTPPAATDYDWTIVSEDNAMAVGVPASVRNSEDRDDVSVIRIDRKRMSLRGQTLIGKRRFVATPKLTLPLPTVRNAGLQQAVVVLSPFLQRTDESSSIQQVPVSASRTNAIKGAPKKLRYDPGDRPTLSMQTVEEPVGQNMIWSKDLVLTASSLGSDRIEARLLVTADRPIKIRSPLDLNLVSVTRDGRRLDLATAGTRRSEITLTTSDEAGVVMLQPPSTPRSAETIALAWNRTRLGTYASRACRVPEIEVDGLVWRSTNRLTASSETVIPSVIGWQMLGNASPSLTPHSREDGPPRSIGMLVRPGDSVQVWRRDLVFGIFACSSLLLFAACWWIAGSRLGLVVSLATMAVAMAILLPTYATGMVAWVILPAICALLLQTSLCRRSHRSPSQTDDNSHEFSVGGPIRAIGLGLVVLLATNRDHTRGQTIQNLGTPSALIETDNSQNGRTAISVVDVLVPHDSDGRRIGEYVYVPSSALRRWKETAAARSVPGMHVQSATYRVDIADNDATDEGGRSDSRVFAGPLAGTAGGQSITASNTTVEAEYGLIFDAPVAEVELPIPPSAVRRVKLISANATVIVPHRAGDPTANSREPTKTIVSIPPSRNAQLRLTLEPRIASTENLRALQLPIPKIASTAVTIAPRTDISEVRFDTAIGNVQENLNGRISAALLGPLDILRLSYEIASDTVNSPIGIAQRRYLIQADLDRTVTDIEITPSNADGIGDVVPVTFGNESIGELISPSWRIDSRVSLIGDRTLIRFQRVVESSEPIRMTLIKCLSCDESPMVDVDGAIASAAASNNGRNGSVSRTISTPQIAASNSAGINDLQPALPLVAVRSSQQSTITPLPDSQLTETTEQEFFRGWFGYPGTETNVYRVDGNRGSFQVATNDVPTVIKKQRHHLHISRSPAANSRRNKDRVDLELRYEGFMQAVSNTADGRFIARPSLTLTVPDLYTLHSLRINGVTAAARMLRDGTKQKYIVSDLPTDRMIFLEMTAVRTTSGTNQFKMPIVRLWSGLNVANDDEGTIATSEFVITHDQDVAIQQAGPAPSIVPMDPVIAESDLLANRWQRFASWSVPRGGTPPSLAKQKLVVQPNKRNSSCEIHTALTWNGSRWSMANELKFDNEPPPFLDIAIPSRWAGELQTEGEESSMSQTSTNGDFVLLRLRTIKKTGEASRQFRITGELTSDEQGGVVASPIKVDGVSVNSRYLSVPDKLTNDPIRWRTLGLERVDIGSVNTDRFAEADQGLQSQVWYRASAKSWTAELTSLPNRNQLIALLQRDARFFIRPDSILVSTRWLIVPGDRRSILVTVPQAASIRSARAAGMPTYAKIGGPIDEQLAELGTATYSRKNVQIDLAFEQLPQTIDLTLEYPRDQVEARTPAAWASFIPEFDSLSSTIVDTDLTGSWISVYESDPESKVSITTTEFNQDSSPTNSLPSRAISQRRIESASIQLKAVEDATDSLADRPLSEVTAWLDVWTSDFEELRTAQQESGTILNETYSDRWSQMTERLKVLRERFATSPRETEEPTPPTTDPDGTFFDGTFFHRERPQGFRPVLASLVGEVDASKIAKANPDTDALVPQPLDSLRLPRLSGVGGHRLNTNSLRVLLVNSLTLISVATLLFFAAMYRTWFERPLQSPITWLFVLGVCCLFVAPPPVAFALMGVAVCFAVFPDDK